MAHTAHERSLYRNLGRAAPAGVEGSVAHGYEALAETFAAHLRQRLEVGAALTVYRRGACVVDLWGGVADQASRSPWRRDTRAVVFSVTKGLAAMALALLADRGELEWDAPVTTLWPEFGAAGKEAITLRTLFNHRAGLCALDEVLDLDDFTRPDQKPRIEEILARSAPLWTPGERQGYHATTYGMYLNAVFERIRGESVGDFLKRELFEPLDADVSLGTPASEDARIATLYPPRNGARVANMVRAYFAGDNTEARIFRSVLSRGSLSRRAFLSPRTGPEGINAYNRPEVRRQCLPWASATASAHGVARAYLPFAQGGAHGGVPYLKAATLEPVYARQGWSDRDLVLQKPLGWSQGFLKEDAGVFSPVLESFGHAGIGGSLGWCDPVNGLTFGYVMNALDWRVRSPRAVALCDALYRCEALRDRA
ncbi:MAG: serine hydrolase domain-containing protein [Polyangiales bacterium]